MTFNTAAGNPRITTPQASMLELPFYREALEGGPGAPILALQEVGGAQARALAAAARRPGARFSLVQLRRPGLGNALVIPDRYELVRARRGFYGWSHVRGVADAAARWARTRRTPNWRQFGELRIWLEASLRDGERRLTVINTHLSVEPSLKVAQAHAVVARARAAAARGPLVFAGDLNVPAGDARGRDAEVAAMLAPFADAGTAIPPGRPNIDYVLVAGFEPVSSRIWTELAVSDHYAEDDLIRYSA